MKKLILPAVLIAIAGMSSCKKDAVQPSANYKPKSIGTIHEHTGWDRDDSTGIEGVSANSTLLRTATPAATTTTTKKTATKK